VLHDHLVSAEIIGHCNPEAHIIDVGKIGHGRHTTQGDIERQLIAHARAGQCVVRLKGGDPLLFGRGSEEAMALRAADIPFEIVPGVSSALAAPAYAGIPLTARGLATSVAIVTGHCAQSATIPEVLPTADTIVILMGIANASAIRDRLMATGRCGETPAAVVEWGTHPQQRVAVGTLHSLPEIIARDRIGAPAVIVIGETVRLRPILDWVELPGSSESVLSV
jgi:uroporphyrinogen III methyltransferase/synthase